MKTISAWPAYGRDYKSKKALLADFDAAKDFNSNLGYFSVRDKEALKKDGFTGIQFRYGKMTKTFILPLY
jgi:hypothetical protein